MKTIELVLLAREVQRHCDSLYDCLRQLDFRARFPLGDVDGEVDDLYRAAVETILSLDCILARPVVMELPLAPFQDEYRDETANLAQILNEARNWIDESFVQYISTSNPLGSISSRHKAMEEWFPFLSGEIEKAAKLPDVARDAIDIAREELNASLKRITAPKPAAQMKQEAELPDATTTHAAAPILDSDTPKKTVNQRMMETIEKNPESKAWSASQWALHLDCAKSTVGETPTFRTLGELREMLRVQRELDDAKKQSRAAIR